MSSSRPGASPTNITRACGLPSANTSCLAVVRSAQPSNRPACARSSSRLAALRAASRAAITAMSGAAGAPGAAGSPEARARRVEPAPRRRAAASEWLGERRRIRLRRRQADRPASRRPARRPRPPHRSPAFRAPRGAWGHGGVDLLASILRIRARPPCRGICGPARDCHGIEIVENL